MLDKIKDLSAQVATRASDAAEGITTSVKGGVESLANSASSLTGSLNDRAVRASTAQMCSILEIALEELKGRASTRTQIVMHVGGLADPNVFRQVHGVQDLRIAEGSHGETYELRITTHDASEIAPRLCECAAQNEWRLLEMRVERPTLEDLFVQITEDDPIAV